MARRVVGLLSDFGEGPYAGIMRAVIRSVGGDEIDIVDIDHSIPSFSVLSGAYVLAHSYYWLPKGSVIVAVVDPGVGSSRMALAIVTRNYVFVGPDNGLLFPAAQRDGIEKVYRLDETKIVNMARIRFKGAIPGGKWIISKTFHGRDVFAPAAALIASEAVDLDEIGEEIDVNSIRKTSIDYVEKVNGGSDSVRVQVVYIDKFGNVALSARAEKLPWGLKIMGERNAWILIDVNGHSEGRMGQYQAKLVSTFSEGKPGELIAYVNSFGHLELAINKGNAAKRLGLQVEMKVTITFTPGLGSHYQAKHHGSANKRVSYQQEREGASDVTYSAVP